MKHTPAPWTIESIEGDDIVFDSDHHSICEVFYDGADTANAHLIAAAPDLLEALEYLMSEADIRSYTDRITPDALIRIKDAINKARGFKTQK